MRNYFIAVILLQKDRGQDAAASLIRSRGIRIFYIFFALISELYLLTTCIFPKHSPDLYPDGIQIAFT
jgi:hypothetical protein